MDRSHRDTLYIYLSIFPLSFSLSLSHVVQLHRDCARGTKSVLCHWAHGNERIVSIVESCNATFVIIIHFSLLRGFIVRGFSIVFPGKRIETSPESIRISLWSIFFPHSFPLHAHSHAFRSARLTPVCTAQSQRATRVRCGCVPSTWCTFVFRSTDGKHIGKYTRGAVCFCGVAVGVLSYTYIRALALL